jgi:hypothetical protein
MIQPDDRQLPESSEDRLQRALALVGPSEVEEKLHAHKILVKSSVDAHAEVRMWLDGYSVASGVESNTIWEYDGGWLAAPAGTEELERILGQEWPQAMSMSPFELEFRQIAGTGNATHIALKWLAAPMEPVLKRVAVYRTMASGGDFIVHDGLYIRPILELSREGLAPVDVVTRNAQELFGMVKLEWLREASPVYADFNRKVHGIWELVQCDVALYVERFHAKKSGKIVQKDKAVLPAILAKAFVGWPRDAKLPEVDQLARFIRTISELAGIDRADQNRCVGIHQVSFKPCELVRKQVPEQQVSEEGGAGVSRRSRQGCSQEQAPR